MHLWIKKTAATLMLGTAFAAALAMPGTSAKELTPLWQLEKFDQPESVVSSANGKILYVSNINGAPTELNGQGYISKLSADGKIIKQHWLGGMNAPKGMAIAGDLLYVADMQQVHVVSLSQGRIINQYQAQQAKMLNDITIANDGSVYISDLLGGGIYRIKHQHMDLWFTHDLLPHPNGLLWHKGKLLVASWGLGMNNDFSTQTPGSLYKLNPEKPSLIPLNSAQNFGNLDGIAIVKNAFYVSDWITGSLFKIQNKKRTKVLNLAPGLADISAYGRILFTPLMLDGQVKAWRL